MIWVQHPVSLGAAPLSLAQPMQLHRGAAHALHHISRIALFARQVLEQGLDQAFDLIFILDGVYTNQPHMLWQISAETC